MTAQLYDPDLVPEPISYEKRLVVFYDILGWRAHIERAGNNAAAIGKLRRAILRPIQMLQMGADRGAAYRFTAFSDNIVISCEVEKTHIDKTLGMLASFVLSSLWNGYLIRGGITIGDVVHDNHAVFGPALNRAYELENKEATYPRIVLDPIAFESRLLPFYITSDDKCWFIDPFTQNFMMLVMCMGQEKSEKASVSAKIRKNEKGLGKYSYDAQELLMLALHVLKKMICTPLEEKEYEKVAWLFDRVAKQLGVPPAHSYPRVRPDDVVE